MGVRGVGGLLLAWLSVAGTASGQDTYEPNQSRRTASALEEGDYKGLFCDDEDWYVVEVGEGRRLEVGVRFDHALGDLELEVYDAQGRLRGWSRGVSDEEVVAAQGAGRETLFVRVHNARNAYDLHVGVTEVQRQAINCWGSDWYWIACPAGAELLARIEFAHAEGDLDLELYDHTGQFVVSSDSQSDGEAVRWVPDAGEGMLLHVLHLRRSRSVYGMDVRVLEPGREDLTEVAGLERPLGAGVDAVELASGDRLRCQVLTEEFELATAYGGLRLPAGVVAGIEVGGAGEPSVVTSVDNNRFTGFLQTSSIRLRVPGAEEAVEVHRLHVRRLVFGQRGGERRGLGRHQYVQLVNGDHFSGRLVPGAWALDMGYFEAPLSLDGVSELAFANGGVSVRYADGTETTGRQVRLHPEVLRFELDLLEGVVVELHVEELLAVHLEEGWIPDGVRVAGTRYLFEAGLEGWEASSGFPTGWVHEAGSGVEGSGCVRLCGPGGGLYGDGCREVALTSPPMNLSYLERPTLRMWARYDLESGCDYVSVQVSEDGGVNFLSLWDFNGQSLTWAEVPPMELPSGEGVVVRFVFRSDGSVQRDGMWVDGIEVVEAD